MLKQCYRRRPRRPPFLLVESEGIGVTSSGGQEHIFQIQIHSFLEETNKSELLITIHFLFDKAHCDTLMYPFAEVLELTDTSDLHAGPSQRSESRLSSRTRSLGPETITDNTY